MRRHLALFAALCAAFAFAAPASALDVGVTDDEGNTNPSFIFPALQSLGMTTNVMSIRWDPLNPTGLPANFLDIASAVNIAAANGVQVILATYQNVGPADGITRTANAPTVFGQWLQRIAQACPLCVRKVVVLNEPNLQFFYNPTFDSSCQPSAPASYAQVLAASYDALKAVDPSIQVLGMGLSPRGNDNCRARSNVSMSPVNFLSELGKAYKAMARSQPLMDGISFHPYPLLNTDGPEVGYRWPNIGVPNLDRLKQAFYDAFNGTGQPLIGPPGGGARGSLATTTPITLDELGWQVDTQGRPGYTDNESVPTITEEQQAEFMAESIARMACDPTVTALNFFHFRDEAHRGRFQSGVVRIDGSTRPSYDAVKNAIAQNQTCQGTPVRWSPAKNVIGAKPIWPAAKTFSKKATIFQFQLTAQEKADFTAAINPVGAAKRKARRLSAVSPVATAKGEIRAYFKPFVRFKKKLKPGKYQFVVTLAASTNPSRKTTFKSPVFTVK